MTLRSISLPKNSRPAYKTGMNNISERIEFPIMTNIGAAEKADAMNRLSGSGRNRRSHA